MPQTKGWAVLPVRRRSHLDANTTVFSEILTVHVTVPDQMAHLMAGTAILKEFSTMTKVGGPVQISFVKEKRMESIYDLCHCYETTTYVQKIQDMLPNTEPFRDKHTRVARAQSAWQSAAPLAQTAFVRHPQGGVVQRRR